MYFGDCNFTGVFLVIAIIIAALGWGLIEVLIWASSFITISIG